MPTAPDLLPTARPNPGVAGAPAARKHLHWRQLAPSPRIVGISAAVTSAAGMLDLVTALSPAFAHHHRRLIDLLPGAVPAGPHAGLSAATTALGLLLLVLANGLRRRKRTAWWATLAALTSSVAVNARHPHGSLALLAAVACLGVLLGAHQHFNAAGDFHGRRRGMWFMLRIVAGLTLAAVTTVLVHTHPRPGVARAIWLTARVVAGGSPPGMRHDTFLVVHVCVLLAAVLGGCGGLWLSLRPGRSPVGSAEDQERVRALLSSHGNNDSLGFFATRLDRSVVLSPSGKSAVTFRVVGATALAAGNPLGDPEAWPGAVTSWLALVARNGWTPAVLGCGQRAAALYAAHGLDVLELGDEAVVETASFTLEGRERRNLRQSVAHARREAHVQVIRAEDLTAEQERDLRVLAELWRGQGSGEERGYAMALSRTLTTADRGCVLVLVTDEAGATVATVQFVPWGTDRLSLDVMRRAPDAPRGVTELALVDAIAWARDHQIVAMSLNFAVFRAAMEAGGRLGAGPVARAQRGMLKGAGKFVQLETLATFNAKFGPSWVPRFICFDGVSSLPRSAVAALRAEAFLCRPRWLGGKPTSH